MEEWDSVHVGSHDAVYRLLCTRCFNREMAQLAEVEFEHVAFEPVVMLDAAGVSHRFHFQLRFLGDRIALDAFEPEADGGDGFRFQAIGRAEADPFELLAELTGRIRRALSRQHLATKDGLTFLADTTVRGRIGWDSDAASGTPLIVIDGRPVRWDEFGRLLMQFEGWQFKLEIRDNSEEV